MGMKTMAEQKTSHTRMMMRKAVKLMYQGILMLLIVMMTGDWKKHLVI